METMLLVLLKGGWDWTWEGEIIVMRKDNFSYTFGTIMGVSLEAIRDMLIRYGRYEADILKTQSGTQNGL